MNKSHSSSGLYTVGIETYYSGEPSGTLVSPNAVKTLSFSEITANRYSNDIFGTAGSSDLFFIIYE